MTQGIDRNNPEYIRILELISKITEEWGETVSSLNMYHATQRIDYIQYASNEINGIHSLTNELQGLLEVMLKLKKNVNK